MFYWRPKMQNETLAEFEKLFLSLSDKTRLRLLGLMSEGEVSVGFLAESLGQSQPKVSRHLAYLRNAGLVSTRRDGKWIYYAASPPANEAVRDVFFHVLASLGNLHVEQDVFRPREDSNIQKAAAAERYVESPEVEIPVQRGAEDELDVFLL